MAESLDDGEFWLPPQFLSDDDLFLDRKRASSTAPTPMSTGAIDVFASEAPPFADDLFPLDFPYGCDIYGGPAAADLCSPVDSLVSAELSDDDDLLAFKLAGLCKVEGDMRGNGVVFGGRNTESWTVFGSPKSTLCGGGSGCLCKRFPGLRCHKQSAKISSPPATMDLLEAAAGKVARMRRNDEGCILSSRNRGILGPLKKSSPIPDFCLSQQSIAYQKLQAARFNLLKQQQMMKQQCAEAWKAPTVSQLQQAQPLFQPTGRTNRGLAAVSPSVCPHVEQIQRRQGGSGMHAVFLGDRSGKRECAGTGVFLPRQIANSASSRKKSGNTTVLLPAKVMQALKSEDGGPTKPQFHRRLNDNTARPRNCNVQKRSTRPQQEFNRAEVRLPRDWTY